jgi:hypothetical protein
VITLSAPPRGPTPSLDAAQSVAGVLVPINVLRRSFPVVPQLTVDAGGTARVQVAIPLTAPAGIYFMAIVGTDPSGTVRVLVCPVVVRRSAGFVAVPAATLRSQPRAVPAEQLAQVQAVAAAAAVTPEREAEMVRRVVDDDEVLAFDGELLVLQRAPEQHALRPIVAALAIGVTGLSFAVVARRPRRRRPLRSR